MGKLGRVLPRSFYARPTVVVARELLGKVLAYGGRAARIVEAEAYLGEDDPCSHAYRGMTGRTRPMFGAPGHTYVYVSYGIHHCVNLVAKEAGRAAGAVLLRGAEPLEGFDGGPRELAGPGLIGRGFRLTTAHSGVDLIAGKIAVHDAPRVRDALVGTSGRIGVTSGHTVRRRWRFYVRGSPGVSRTPRN